MKKQFFARLVELVHHQVLITKVVTDNPEALYGVRFETDIWDDQKEKYVRIGANFGFKTEVDRDDAYITFDMKRCQETVEQILTQAEVVNHYLGGEEEEKPKSSLIL